MWYTIWRKLSPNTYRFYMAAETYSVVQSTLDSHSNLAGAVVTKTAFLPASNFIHINDLNKLPQI